MVRAFNQALSPHAENCATDEKLKEVLSAISTMDVYLSRLLQAAIVSHSNGGTMPLPEGPPTTSILLPQMTAAVLETTDPRLTKRMMHLRHWVELQHAASFAASTALSRLGESSEA
jgi:hypothetical protein